MTSKLQQDRKYTKDKSGKASDGRITKIEISNIL